jgi:ceramide glucosyltransferase
VTWLLVLGHFFAVLILAERLVKYLLVRDFFARNTQRAIAPDACSPVEQRPTVSVLQPILSGDPTLWHCLTENLERPSRISSEFLWLVDEDDHMAISGCQKIIDNNPHSPVRLILCPPAPEGCNPKLFKLILGAGSAQGIYIAVLDDDTVLPAHSWEQVLPTLDSPGAGLAFGLPYYAHFQNVWSALVSAFVNSNSLLTYVPYTYIHPPFTINGMFYVVKRTVFDRINGFTGLENQLCDDFAVAQRLRSHGYRLVQTSLRHPIHTHVSSPRAYLRLLNRWFIFPQVSIMQQVSSRELLLFYTFAFVPTFLPLLLAFICIATASSALALWLIGYLAGQAAMLWRFNSMYLAGATPLKYLPLLLLIQFLLPLHVAWAYMSPRNIYWRGHKMAAHPDGSLSYLQRRSGAVTQITDDRINSQSLVESTADLPTDDASHPIPTQ